MSGGVGRSPASTVGEVVSQKDVECRGSQSPGVETVGREPGAEVLDGLDVKLDGAQGMPTLVEILNVGIDRGAEPIGLDAG
jgi:hypothetical protein